jgi:hypothetical protein
MKNAKPQPQPHAFVVDVARTPASAYNPNRPISGLIESQIRRLHEPERRLPRRHHTGVDVGMIKTEGEAADYIGRVTAAIHAHARAQAKSLTTKNTKGTKRTKAKGRTTKGTKRTSKKARRGARRRGR